MSLLLESFPVGIFQCNCTVIADPVTREAVVIDPGDEAPRIVALLRQNDLDAKYLLHTHAHLDHIGATNGVQRVAGAKSCLHRDDLFLYDDVEAQARMIALPAPEAPPPVDLWLEDGLHIALENFGIRVLHTPGHTPGSCCFSLEDSSDGASRIFTGDTLFRLSIGRTDLPGGNTAQIFDSIRSSLLSLADETHVTPGHGPSTSIGVERRENPFLQ